MKTKKDIEETKEQLLIRRVFNQICESHFHDNKLLSTYCGNIRFDRSVGSDICNYVQNIYPKFYHNKRKESDHFRKEQSQLK